MIRSRTMILAGSLAALTLAGSVSSAFARNNYDPHADYFRHRYNRGYGHGAYGRGGYGGYGGGAVAAGAALGILGAATAGIAADRYYNGYPAYTYGPGYGPRYGYDYYPDHGYYGPY